jgi:hypothetical protein
MALVMPVPENFVHGPTPDKSSIAEAALTTKAGNLTLDGDNGCGPTEHTFFVMCRSKWQWSDAVAEGVERF